jgi:hypothetical protein
MLMMMLVKVVGLTLVDLVGETVVWVVGACAWVVRM